MGKAGSTHSAQPAWSCTCRLCSLLPRPLCRAVEPCPANLPCRPPPVLQRIARRTLRVAQAQRTQILLQVVPHQDAPLQQGRQLAANRGNWSGAVPQRGVVPALVLPAGVGKLALCRAGGGMRSALSSQSVTKRLNHRAVQPLLSPHQAPTQRVEVRVQQHLAGGIHCAHLHRQADVAAVCMGRGGTAVMSGITEEAAAHVNAASECSMCECSTCECSKLCEPFGRLQHCRGPHSQPQRAACADLAGGGECTPRLAPPAHQPHAAACSAVAAQLVPHLQLLLLLLLCRRLLLPLHHGLDPAL